MKLIHLTQGKFAQVSDRDYKYLMQWKWCYDGGYAHRKRGKKKIYMHRDIKKTPKGVKTDHRNGNGLNNQRRNLRNCTQSQNCMNRIVKKGSSKYKGVSIFKRDNNWRVRIKINGKTKHLGYFDIDKEKQAARAYNRAAKKLHGKFAKLNIIRNAA